jgi:cell division protein FtsL
MTATQRPAGLRPARQAPAPRQAPGPRQAPLRLVRPGELSPQARLRRRRLAVIGVAALVVLCLFGVVIEHAVLAEQQFRLANLESQVAQDQADNESLSLQVAQLSAPGRIVSEAQRKLGMVQPPAITYLMPESNGARVKGEAAPTSTTQAPSTRS